MPPLRLDTSTKSLHHLRHTPNEKPGIGTNPNHLKSLGNACLTILSIRRHDSAGKAPSPNLVFDSKISSATPGPSHSPTYPEDAEKSAGPKKKASTPGTCRIESMFLPAATVSINGMTSVFSLPERARDKPLPQRWLFRRRPHEIHGEDIWRSTPLARPLQPCRSGEQ